MNESESHHAFNLWEVFSSVADVIPERDCLVWRDRRLSFSDVRKWAQQVSWILRQEELGLRAERQSLKGHESGQSHVGILLHNGPEYIEAMLGAYAARAVPFNINYRYGDEELHLILEESGAEALIYYSPTRSVLPRRGHR